ncbi:hypothetical protein [Leucobacter komagatae]|uniref:Uncharacterized protein n=1 Tax=Leucobacter komagatae TaxID=55969 RepID=A0A0D0IIN4_9MICO|nr:hypothetical protein [Leucobacter komagatae]KIP51484.1 hypothetical protein SD72_15125 [Leucobacter komagatae]
MNTPEPLNSPDLSKLPPPSISADPPSHDGAKAIPKTAEASRPPRNLRRTWLWIVLAAVLVVGGAAATVVLVSQANDAAATEGALKENSDAVSAYEKAWEGFEKQSSDTRDDQGQLSMTSLDNTEEVVDAFTTAITAADALEYIEPHTPDAGTAVEKINSDTQKVEAATGEATKVTKQLAAASALFLDSHRSITAKYLTDEIAKAETVLESERSRADADLVAQLEKALTDARTLAEDPKAHPTDLRETLQNLVTLTGKVTDSAGPRVEDIESGEWSILPGDVLGTGGAVGLTVNGIEISAKNNPSGAYTGPDIFQYTTPIWSEKGGCLVADGKVHRHSQLWFCPAGTPVPSEAHDKIYSLKSGDQTEDVSQDRLIGNWFMYLM